MALNCQDATIELPTKPGSHIHYTYNAPPTEAVPSDYLVVCLNGLLLSQEGWFPSLFQLRQLLKARNRPSPNLLTYDRWSQGRTSSRDPHESTSEPDYGHDIMNSVHDLHEILLLINKGTIPALIFLANSIGCVLARLYARTYPGTMHALILLDSMMANSDFVSLWPDPDASAFDAATALPPDVSIEHLRTARENYRRLFHPTVPNAEHLDRRNLAHLLPRADAPLLPAADSTGLRPLLVVVGHDPETFARESEERLGTPAALTHRYSNAKWHEYNMGLLRITDEGRATGPVIATGCGHFVQRDDPAFVAGVVAEVLDAVGEGRRARV